MSIAAVIVKIMPESPDEDLERISVEAEEILEEDGAKNISFEEKPVAFGLKAIMIKFAPWAKSQSTASLVY